MIDIEKVKNMTALLGNLDDAQVEKYLSIIENATETVNNTLVSQSDADYARAAYLAAATANYNIALAAAAADDSVTSFTAGDVKISKSSYAKSENARILLENAKQICSDIISDSSFAFINV